MKSEITVRTQGVKGGDAKFTNVGCTTIYATDNGQTKSDLAIDVDSFTGSGRDYQRRENTRIDIEFQGKVLFKGTIDELVAKLAPELLDALKDLVEKTSPIHVFLSLLRGSLLSCATALHRTGRWITLECFCKRRDL